MAIKHSRTSTEPDSTDLDDAALIQPSDWNEDHVIEDGTIEPGHLADETAEQFQPQDDTLDALAGLNSSAGLVEQTGADTFTKRALGVGASTSVPTRADADGRYAAASHTHPESEVTGLVGDLALKAPLASPALTGTPTAPTAAPGDNSTLLANTAFVKAAVDVAVTGLLDFKGSTNASANPNYPAASKGDAYIVSVAGKVGGASGKSVDIGDVYVASADNAGGTEASVGTSWFVLEHNLVGALLVANALSELTGVAATARSNLGLGAVATLATVTEADITLADNTTDDVSTTKHGFVPKAPNVATKYLDGTGAWSTIAVTAVGGASPAVLSDLTDLAAWYSADDPNNTVGANTGIVTTFYDKSGNGRHYTPGSGTIVKEYAAIAGLPCFSFRTALSANGPNLVLPLKGALTYFAILKVTNTGSYQNLFIPIGGSDPTDVHLYWDVADKWQIDGRVTGVAVAGAWHAIVVHYYNVGSDMKMKMRSEGAEIQSVIGSTVTGHPIAGTSGTPVNYTLNLFRAGGNAFTSRIAEWGFYVATRDGSETTLEAYLRARAGTW